MPVNEVVVNVFFSFFWGAVVVRGQDNEVPPRRGAGVRRLIFTIIGTFFLFFWSPSLWSPSFWCKTLLINGQKCFNNKNLAAMSSFVVLETNCSQFFIVETLLTICKQCFPQCFPFTLTVWSKKKIHYILVINSMRLFIFIVFFDCRCCYHHYNDDVTTHFLLLKHFWPLINNVLHQNEGLHIDGLNKKIIISPTGVKMSLRTPSPPRGGTSLWWLLTTTAPQKNEKKTFTTTSFTGILTQSTVCSTYPNYRPF